MSRGYNNISSPPTEFVGRKYAAKLLGITEANVGSLVRRGRLTEYYDGEGTKVGLRKNELHMFARTYKPKFRAECHNGHPWSTPGVEKFDKRGNRYCAVCHRKRLQAWHEKRRNDAFLTPDIDLEAFLGLGEKSGPNIETFVRMVIRRRDRQWLMKLRNEAKNADHEVPPVQLQGVDG